VEVLGAGFFDIGHILKGRSHNGIELHPVLSLTEITEGVTGAIGAAERKHEATRLPDSPSNASGSFASLRMTGRGGLARHIVNDKHPGACRNAAGVRGARSLPEGRSLAPRERSAGAGSRHQAQIPRSARSDGGGR